MRLFPLYLAMVMILEGCGAQWPQVRAVPIPVSELPQMLRPVPGAAEVEAGGGDGVFGVSYVLDSAYPAAEVLAAIEASIPPEWTPRTEDSVNPGIPTSHVRGWTEYKDLTTTPESWVHAWQSEWQNAVGDILSYNLIYRSNGPFGAIQNLSNPTNSRLRIGAEVVPQAIAEAMTRFVHQEAKRFAEEHQ